MESNVPDLSLLARKHTPAAEKPKAIAQPTRRWKTRVLLPLGTLALFLGMTAYALRDAFWPATPVRVAPVVAKSSGEVGGTAMFQAAGWIEPDPFPIHVPALTDGVVKEVLVLEGQRVKAGDVLARLVDDEIKLALQQAEAELHHKTGHLGILQATHRAAQDDWKHPIERERAVAAAGAVLSEARAERVRLDREIQVEEARLNELEEQLRRENKAAEVSAIPEIQRVQTELKRNTQQAVLEAARARVPALDAKVRHAEAELKAADENLRLRINEKKALEESEAGVCEAEGQVKMAQLAVAQAKLRMTRTEVRSPVDGVVMQRLIEPGSKLMMLMDDRTSAHVARLYDPKRLQVRVDVPLAEAARVGVGQEANVTVEVLKDKTFKGVVTRVVNEADIQKNTLQAKVSLSDPAPELKPEMLARVQFLSAAKAESGTRQQRLFAQKQALQVTGDQGTAWIVDKGRKKAVRRQVKLGPSRSAGWVEVAEGLQPGDVLIVGDTTQLREGQRVRILEEAVERQGDGSHGSH